MAVAVLTLSDKPPLHRLAEKIDQEGDSNGNLTKLEVRRYRRRVDAADVRLTKRTVQTLRRLERLVCGPSRGRGSGKAGVSVSRFLAGSREVDPSGNLARLNKTQQAVIADAAAKSKERSAAARERLVRWVRRLGYSEADLDRGLRYVEEVAPVCINFHPDKSLELTTRGNGRSYKVSVPRDSGRLIDALLRDGEYKNQFETGVTGFSPTAYPGGGRDRWEKTIFESGYHTHRLVAAERPRYGALNAANLRAGPASYYGSCYLVLKQGIKARTTFSFGDSSDRRARHIGTAHDFQHVMLSTREAYVCAILEIAAGKKKRAEKSKLSYIEAQIHGPVDLKQDVAYLVANRKFKGTQYEAKLVELADRYGFPIRWSRG